MNILITSASRKVALVRTFREALGEEGGGSVIAADTSALSAALYEADAGVLVPPSRDPGFVAHMLALCAARGVRLLVPTRDEELPVFAAHRDAFRDAGVLVMVASPATIARCQDKAAFHDFCVAHGFAVPRMLDRAAAWTPAGAFLRPRTGKGGAGAMKVTSRAELDAAVERTPDALVQEVIDAPEYTIDLFADFDGRLISIVPRERVRIVAGESYVSRTARIPALIDAAARLAAALGLVGHNTVQCFFDGTSPTFIEVNPRYGGAAQLGFAAGACTPRFLVRLAAGKRVEPRVGEFEDGLVMLRFTDDVFLREAALLA
jgi:carbamoyl-phosphate synthase large subunit